MAENAELVVGQVATVGTVAGTEICCCFSTSATALATETATVDRRDTDEAADTSEVCFFSTSATVMGTDERGGTDVVDTSEETSIGEGSGVTLLVEELSGEPIAEEC